MLLVDRQKELGSLRKLRGLNNQHEVQRILKAFIDAQWLNEFDHRLEEYQKRMNDQT